MEGWCLIVNAGWWSRKRACLPMVGWCLIVNEGWWRRKRVCILTEHERRSTPPPYRQWIRQWSIAGKLAILWFPDEAMRVRIFQYVEHIESIEILVNFHYKGIIENTLKYRNDIHVLCCLNMYTNIIHILVIRNMYVCGSRVSGPRLPPDGMGRKVSAPPRPWWYGWFIKTRWPDLSKRASGRPRC